MFYSYFTACLFPYSVAWKVFSRNKSTFNLSDIFCKLLHQTVSVLCKDNFKVNKIQDVQNEKNLLNYLNENYRTRRAYVIRHMHATVAEDANSSVTKSFNTKTCPCNHTEIKNKL